MFPLTDAGRRTTTSQGASACCRMTDIYWQIPHVKNTHRHIHAVHEVLCGVLYRCTQRWIQKKFTGSQEKGGCSKRCDWGTKLLHFRSLVGSKRMMARWSVEFDIVPLVTSVTMYGKEMFRTNSLMIVVNVQPLNRSGETLYNSNRNTWLSLREQTATPAIYRRAQ